MQRRRRAHRALAASLSAAALIAAMLRCFPPDRYGFYPVCPFHAVTGLLCPGCGATRALAALLQDDLPQALHRNALVVVLLPMLAGFGLLAYFRAAAGAPPLRAPRLAPLVLPAIAVAFGILRNVG